MRPLFTNSPRRCVEEPSATELLPDQVFVQMLSLERKRSERSGSHFVLMLVKPKHPQHSLTSMPQFDELLEVLSGSTRETDIKGWYSAKSVIGVIFTETGNSDRRGIVNALATRLTTVLSISIGAAGANQIHLSFHPYPDDWNTDSGRGTSVDAYLYPDLRLQDTTRRLSRLLKRCLDVGGSLAGLLVLAPLLVTVAAMIKLTSRGPILFRQTRLGRYARPFTFLKFRSMHVKNDDRLHQEFVKHLISKEHGQLRPNTGSSIAYKMTQDPRVTWFGRLLRRTSIDELPQLLNVLKGDMSLVGPRPPILYEFERYEVWHRARLRSVKPGITGLWQVTGRSRVPFETMVRLDLEYARTWSPWLDIKILLRTPRAVVSGDGAY